MARVKKHWSGTMWESLSSEEELHQSGQLTEGLLCAGLSGAADWGNKLRHPRESGNGNRFSQSWLTSADAWKYIQSIWGSQKRRKLNFFFFFLKKASDAKLTYFGFPFLTHNCHIWGRKQQALINDYQLGLPNLVVAFVCSSWRIWILFIDNIIILSWCRAGSSYLIKHQWPDVLLRITQHSFTG